MKHMLRTICSSALILVLALLFVGCMEEDIPAQVDKSAVKTDNLDMDATSTDISEEDQSVAVVESENTSDNSEDVATEIPKPEVFKVGDAVELGGFNFMLNSVRWDNGSKYLKPDEGKKWLVVNGTIENIEANSASVSSMLMFSLYDIEGYEKDLAIGAETEGNLDGTLGVGRIMRGELAYEVEEGQTEWDLIFTPEVFNTSNATFRITVEDIK